MTEAAKEEAVDIKEDRPGKGAAEAASDADSLASLPLADLHRLAAEAGIARYRLMRREKLAEAIGAASPAAARAGSPAAEPAADATRPAGRRRGGRRRATPRNASREAPAEAQEGGQGEGEIDEGAAGAEERTITGIVELSADGSGSVRVAGFFRSSEDGYVTQGQVRRVGLRAGDEVTGTAGGSRRGRRSPLARVDTVNGTDLGPDDALDDRPRFEDLTAAAPARRLALDRVGEDLFARSVDLVSPQGYGQRTLVTGQDAADVSMAVRSIVRAACAADESIEPIVVTVDRAAEEATAWRAELERATVACVDPETDASRVAEAVALVFERAKRRAESGSDVLVAVDSFGALAPIFTIAAAASGASQAERTALRELSGLLRCGRDLREDGAGSITVIAGVAVRDSVPADRALVGALLQMASSSVSLAGGTAQQASADDHPLLDVAACGTRGSSGFLGRDDVSARAALKAELLGLDPPEARARLESRLADAPSGAGLVAGV